MIRISQRQLFIIIGLGAVALLAAVLSRLNMVGPNGCATIVFLAAALAVLAGPSEGASNEVFDSLRAAVRRVLEGKKPEPPLGAPLAVLQVYQDLQEAHQTFEELSTRSNRNEVELQEAAVSLSAAVRTLTEGVAAQLNASDETAKYVKEVTNALREIAQHVEVLAANAEESSSSVLQMTATNEQVGGNIVELAASVRETVASIEEMAYSIKEVAKNVDALSLTAEETSSSMNEMDVSIDQVQSNANETARLSEEVAQDAERGAEAILKTIGEIYRIKESSQEAVAVISNLGSRIDAIGQILNVIDDVAEQTNLLALNAAIIAAQAGEHGKGFAVVADEIKDLAERAGASTKEIADLIKTIQAESKNAIQAVERGAQNVDRGVEVSNEAERALKKILESSQKSTNMVRAIARATVEQAKGSKQVTDAIGRIAATVQQIAAATAQQARGSELIMKSGEKMRTISQQVERSSQEQSRGSRQITQSIETINNLVNQLNSAHRSQARGSERALTAATQIEEAARRQDHALRDLITSTERMKKSVA
ncbi:MAG TPA: methyl-accepting chemotaxis protein [Polyangiaceae bacterium]|jgi:methyl-accepting chemotaxis protein|nr:methyl-accepting chemotaxis protein [Polyangiaceae bacterium]